MRLSSLTTVLALFLTGCGDVLFLEGSVNQLCQRLPAQRFGVPAVPSAVANQLPKSITLERRFDFDITAQLPPELDRAQLTISLDRMTLTAASSATDLRFIEAAHVTLEPPANSKLPPKAVARVAESSASRLKLAGDDLELLPYLESGVLSYTVALTASTMPQTEVAADVDACANVSLRWNYAQ